MHKLDNDDIALGDKVYDVMYGPGEVVELKVEGKFRVRFATGMHVYDERGVRVDSKFRTLYWHDPVVVLPEKDDIRWALAKRLCTAMIEELRAHT